MRAMQVRVIARKLDRASTKKLLRSLGLKLRFVHRYNGNIRRATDKFDSIDLQIVKPNDKCIGVISLINNGNHWQTVSSTGIPVSLRGTGIGLYMYEELIYYGMSLGLRVTSSDFFEMNENSHRIWKKLNVTFRVRSSDHNSRHYVLGQRIMK